MFFLRTGTGSVQAGLFTEPAGERTGVARGRELATAVARTGADAVGCVAEVWSRPIGSIPRSTSDRGQDALLVAVIDREGRSIVLVTTIDRRDDGSVALGVSDEWTDGGYDLTFLEPVRALWASID